MAALSKPCAPAPPAVVERGGKRWVVRGHVATVIAWCCAHEVELTEHLQWQLVFDRIGGQRVKVNLRKHFDDMA